MSFREIPLLTYFPGRSRIPLLFDILNALFVNLLAAPARGGGEDPRPPPPPEKIKRVKPLLRFNCPGSPLPRPTQSTTCRGSLYMQYPGAMYQVISRGNPRQDIYLDDLDRQDSLKTLAEACQKTRWQIPAYCLMRNHYRLVVETPNANLVGYLNMAAYLRRLVPTFPGIQHVVIAGSSAGGFGATLNWMQTQQAFGKARVDLIDDSGPILPPDAQILRERSIPGQWRGVH